MQQQSHNHISFQLCTEEPEHCPVLAGTLKTFIHKHQLTWRVPNPYESTIPITCYIRNRQYTEENLRTPETLSYCCYYLLTKVMALFDDPAYKRTETMEFIKDRLRAIRCQAYIQSYIDSEMMEQMLRFQLICAADTGDMAELRTTLDSYYSSGKFRYTSFTTLCLLVMAIDGRSYGKVLANLPDDILQTPSTQRAIRIANTLYLKQFHSFFTYLNSSDFLEGCLLYLYCDQMRKQALRCFSKAQINMPLSYISNLLFFDGPNQLLDYLQKLHYPDVERARRELDKNQGEVFISMKGGGGGEEEEQNREEAPKRLWGKLGDKKLVDIVCEEH